MQTEIDERRPSERIESGEYTNKSNDIRREEFRGRRYEESETRVEEKLQDRRILTWLNLLNNRYFVIKGVKSRGENL